MTVLPPEPTNPDRRNSRAGVASRQLSAWCGVCVITVAVAVLIGWAFDVPALTGLFGAITMKTNAAIALLLCGTALCVFHRVPVLSALCAASTAAIAGLTLFEHASGWDLGIDQALFMEPAGALATASPNRMGPNAATSLLIAGLSILLLISRSRRAAVIAQRMTLTGGALALLALAGYVYGVQQLYSIAQVTGIAWHTAVTLLVLHFGILAARTDAGPMARFVSDGPEGTMLRRLGLPITLVPFVVGYLVLLGRNANLYDRGLALALLALSLVVILWITVWHTAATLEQSDQQRRQAEQTRDLLLVRERQARDEAERASQLKDQFIATLSHELRTPLNVMLGWTQVLESGTRRDQHAHAAAVVARNGRLLARLIEDLLDLSRATAGQFEVTRAPVSLNGIVTAALDGVAPLAAKKSLQVVRSLDDQIGEIQADADRLQQVVWNLLSNAVKFTPAGGRIEVRTTALEGAARLEVTDTGIGFEDAFAPYVFEPFRQADPSMRREHGGLGLGLSIARHLVELHGGSITGTSPGAGKGSTFTVTLPTSSPSAATPPRELTLHTQ